MHTFDFGQQDSSNGQYSEAVCPIPVRLSRVVDAGKALERQQWEKLFVHGSVCALISSVHDWAGLVSLTALQTLARTSLKYRHTLGPSVIPMLLQALPKSLFKDYCILVLQRLTFKCQQNAALLTSSLDLLVQELKSIDSYSEENEGMVSIIAFGCTNHSTGHRWS
jgi:hypothetical protein